MSQPIARRQQAKKGRAFSFLDVGGPKVSEKQATRLSNTLGICLGKQPGDQNPEQLRCHARLCVHIRWRSPYRQGVQGLAHDVFVLVFLYAYRQL